VSDRVAFLRKTYAHLAGAIVAFMALIYIFLYPLGETVAYPITKFALPQLFDPSATGYNWLIFIGLFMGAGWVAEKWAQSDVSRGMQYLGLALYVVAEAIVFIPMLFIAVYYLEAPEIIPQAGLITLVLFAGLTATVFITKKDFSFMRGALMMGSFAAMAIIVAGIIFGFGLGILFAGAMCVLAGGYVLYYTSRVMGHYHTEQYVAASLALFAAIALLFYYVIYILMKLRR
jgi:uncharacterized protein